MKPKNKAGEILIAKARLIYTILRSTAGVGRVGQMIADGIPFENFSRDDVVTLGLVARKYEQGLNDIDQTAETNGQTSTAAKAPEIVTPDEVIPPPSKET